MSRRTAIWLAVVAMTSSAAFALGRYVQHIKTGYHYKVIRQESYETSVGTIRCECVSESVGLPFLDPSTSKIVLEDDSGLELTLYKAQRVFQESYPYFEDIVVGDGEIEWDDGCFAYTLELRPSKTGGNWAYPAGDSHDQDAGNPVVRPDDAEP
ncbi:MAG: hypothetical protein KDB27_28840 [Planctomycetales bacterium]|nr:hypothetical protein [Planctomycetales bacterium]